MLDLVQQKGCSTTYLHPYIHICRHASNCTPILLALLCTTPTTPYMLIHISFFLSISFLFFQTDRQREKIEREREFQREKGRLVFSLLLVATQIPSKAEGCRRECYPSKHFISILFSLIFFVAYMLYVCVVLNVCGSRARG